MAAPPPAFGGDRVFADDPQNIGVPTLLGDFTALFLQSLHRQRGEAADDDARAVIDAEANRARVLLAASNASQARESAIRELQPVTRVPVNPYGAEENVANIRMNNIPTFTGGSADTIDVMAWISRIFNLAESKQLTFNATVNLLIQGSSKGAANYIDEMKQEGKTLHQIVQQLEMRYGSLTTVEDARIKCNNMIRKPDEHLSDFIDRLRLMAKMACRQEPNENLRRRAMDILVEGNIRRVLPSSVRAALEERIMNRSLMGLPALSARGIEKECLELETKRKERKLELKGLAQGKKHYVNVAKHEVDSDDDSSDSSDEDCQDEDYTQDGLINEIKLQKMKYFQRGRPPNDGKVMRRAVKNYNQKFQFRNNGKPGQYGARQAGLYPNPAVQVGPPNKLEGGKKPIYELLALANCSRGQCLQCGNDGHMMKNMSCALKDKPLMDRACVKCGKGLHSADDCPKVFQRDYQSPADAPAKEPLNG
jgi:hypothetical protein